MINYYEDLSGQSGDPFELILYTPFLADFNQDWAIDLWSQVPYLDLACFLLSTPNVSLDPRTT